jgi:transmembrane sensor
MNDESLNIEDLLGNDSFISWVLQDEDALLWEEFIRANPGKKELVEKASKIVLDLHRTEQEAVPSIDEQKLWARIASTAESRDEPLVRVKPERKMLRMLLVAAGLVLIGTLGVFQTMRPTGNA